jgi:hypothetical protein
MECSGNAANSMLPKIELGFLSIFGLKAIFVSSETPTSIRISREIYLHINNVWLTIFFFAIPEFIFIFLFQIIVKYFKRQPI